MDVGEVLEVEVRLDEDAGRVGDEDRVSEAGQGRRVGEGKRGGGAAGRRPVVGTGGAWSRGVADSRRTAADPNDSLVELHRSKRVILVGPCDGRQGGRAREEALRLPSLQPSTHTTPPSGARLLHRLRLLDRPDHGRVPDTLPM